ncbi:hypothetical protein FP388_08975 [Citrobacter europaeus]|nr:hypothetical protein [Citrobacter europaeus]
MRMNTYRQALAQHPPPLHHTDHILAFQRLSIMDRQTLPTKQLILLKNKYLYGSVKQLTVEAVIPCLN